MPITEGGRFTPNDRIVSPGVFSREIDQSGVAQGVADIGGVVVAPFAKGPGFSPTLVRSVAELEQKFGTADGTLYGPYTAKEYLKEKGFVTVCRVGALTGYHQKYPFIIWAEKGTWIRAAGTGSILSGSSTVSTDSITNTTASLIKLQNVNFIAPNWSGSIIFNITPVAFSVSGSIYTSEAVTGTISGSLYFSGSIGSYDTNSAQDVILDYLLSQGSVTGYLTSSGTPIFVTTQTPFASPTAIFLSKVSQSVDACGNQTLRLGGELRGLIGNYTGNFTGGIGTYSACENSWSMSGYEQKVLAVLADTQYGGINNSLEAPGFYNSTQSYNPSPSGTSTVGLDFTLALSQSLAGGYGTYNFSLDPNDIDYITNVFSKDPRVSPTADDVAAGSKIEAGYLYKLFEDDIAAVAADTSKWKIWGTQFPSGSWTGEPLNFTDRYSLDLLNGDSEYGLTNASTPWVLSQQIAAWNGGSATRFPLFKLWTLSDGTYTNTSFKIEISNVKLADTVAGSDWGTFTLTVRDYSDTDKKPKILEQFNGLNLDPTSANFVARRIGDRYNYIRYDGKIIEFGTYDNLSRNVRIEMSTTPYPVTAVPYAFQAMTVPVDGSLGQHCNPVGYTKASVYSLFPGKYPSGVDFGGIPSGADNELTALYPSSSAGNGHWRDNLQYFAPVPSGATIGFNTVFALDENISGSGVSTGSYISASNAIPAIYDATKESTYVKMRKFVFGFQGGFDGQSPAIPLNIGADIVPGNTQGLNCTNSTTAGSIAYNQCIGALGNADEFDINLIVTPGIIYSLHSYVTNLVVDMCETRGDCFYIADLYQDDGNPTAGQIDEIVNLASDFDTSYAGTYYPWIKIKDTNINQIVTVPPSVVLPGVYASNDRVAGEWWAVAGLNRGGIPLAVQVTDRTTHTERDTLYEGRVNPIASFPGQGIVVWGQKTLQVKSSALDRIGVRRLLIEVKKFFASTARFMLFEQNTASTRNSFLAVVNPYLESIQQRSGLYAFQVVMDESNNTPDLIDRNILYGQIYLQPTKTAEMIILDFNIMPTGATFPNS